MFKTRITEMLGIEYPIIQGGMARVSCPELAAAVSNAGGLGILISAGLTPEGLREEIKKTKSLTDKPFGVNISLFPSIEPLPNDKFVDVIIDEGVAMVESSGFKGPDEFVEPLRKGNVKLIHKCAGVRYAQTAERMGVDAVAVVGVENGGAVGTLDVGTFVLIPAAVSAVSLPVIAGGGIGDARGFVAAMALGAEGVVIGTRFMATTESPIHPKAKERMLQAREMDTMVIMRAIRNNHRVLKNQAAEEELKLEERGAPLEEILEVISGKEAGRVFSDGELDAGIFGCGQVVGLINEVVSVKEVIDGIVNGAITIRKKLDGVLQPA